MAAFTALAEKMYKNIKKSKQEDTSKKPIMHDPDIEYRPTGM